MVESLEGRVAPASLSLAGGRLTFVADFEEANLLTVEPVNVGGVNYLRFRDDGPGVTIAPAGAGLVVDAPNRVRAPLAGLTSLEISTQPIQDPFNPGDPDLVDDAVRLVMGPAMPSAISLDLGPSDGDVLTVAGTDGNDTFHVVPSWSGIGARVLELSHAGSTIQFGDAESLTFDLTGAGQDVLQLDRYVAGLDRPVAFHVAGGGTGSDLLQIDTPGNVPQTVDLFDGHLVARDTPPGEELLLGRSDNIAIDQPRVTIEVITYDNQGNPVPLIDPEDIGAYFETILLDTGANGILAANELSSALIDAGIQIDGYYQEQGVAGFHDVAVTAPYRVDFAGFDGIRNTIEDVRLELSDQSFSFFGPWGIGGMPLMVNRVVDIDMSHWADIYTNPDPTALGLKNTFYDAMPPDSGHFYHVPLQMVDFPPSGAYPNNPIPTFAPLPEIPVTIRENGREVQGYFLVDTGAQLSILSSAAAEALGLDRNGNGSFDDEAVEFIEVSGVGGTTLMPLLPVDQAAVPTLEGPELLWNKLLLGIIDIEVPDGPTLFGVFGMDYLTSGWATKVLGGLLGGPPTDENGFFNHVYFDFRDAADHQGTLVFDVRPEHDSPGAAIPNTLDLTYTDLDAIQVGTGTGDDLVSVIPSSSVAYTLDGGPHDSGDTLQVIVPNGVMATNDGTTIHVPGFLDIHHANFENINVGTGDTTSPTAVLAPISPDPRWTPVNSATITFSEPVFQFDISDLRLTRDGAPVSLAGVSLAPAGGNSFQINGLTAATTAPGHYVLSLVASGSGITDLAGNPLGGDASDGWTTFGSLIVTAITPTNSGVTVAFNHALDAATLNLWATEADPLAAPDLTLVGNSIGMVLGSMVVAPDHRSVTFIATGGPLPNDSYTLTLRSAADGFRDSTGSALDGNADGVPGGGVTTTFSVTFAPSTPTVGLPDVVRGPGQAVDVPVASTGLPITLSDGSGVTNVSVELYFDPSLIDVIDVAPGADADSFAIVVLTPVGPGHVRLDYVGFYTLGAGPREVFRLIADVPEGADYSSKGVLHLTNVSLDEGAVAARGDDALLVVSFPGDVTGNGSVTVADSTQLRRFFAGLTRSFVGFQNVDPAIVADVNGGGSATIADSTQLLRFLAGLSSSVPSVPPGYAPSAFGHDPKLSLPDVVAEPGARVSVPLRLEHTDVVPVDLDSFETVIQYDPSAFRVTGVRTGSLAEGFDLIVRVDESAGLIFVGGGGLNPLHLRPGDTGDLVWLDLEVSEDALAGVRPFNLRDGADAGNRGTVKTQLNEGRLVVRPAPTDAADDPVDGTIRIVRRPVARSGPIGTPAVGRGHSSLISFVVVPLSPSELATPPSATRRADAPAPAATPIPWTDLVDAALELIAGRKRFAILVF